MCVSVFAVYLCITVCICTRLQLGELEERYEECVSLLYEKQNEIKTLRKKAAPSVIHQHYGTSPFFMPEGSLALELEKSQTEESCPEDYKAKNRRSVPSQSKGDLYPSTELDS